VAPAIAGLALTYWPVLTSGFAGTPGRGADGRHIRWMLEWSHLCATGADVCREWLSPPIYHPLREILPATELLLGQLPVYSLFRIGGAAPLLAHELALALLLLAAYAAGWWMLRRVFGLTAGGSALGAFLFAFAAPRSAQHVHPQLAGFAALPLAVGALAIAIGACPRPHNGRRRWWALAGAALVWHAYASLALAWLAAVWLALVAGFALALPATRRQLGAAWSTDRRALLATAALTLVAIAPLLALHLEARSRFGSSDLFDEEVAPLLPRPASWIDTGADGWSGAALRRAGLVLPEAPFHWEQKLGIGLFTTALAGAGAWRARAHPWGRVLALASLASIAVTTWWPGGWSLWRYVHAVTPGADAVRAAGRIALVLLLPASAALASARAGLASGAGLRRAILPAMALLVAVEQGRNSPLRRWWSDEARVERLARAIPPDCAVFAHTFEAANHHPSSEHVDAMWAALQTGIPTVNGWTSYVPSEALPTFEAVLRGPVEQARHRAALETWALDHRFPPGSLCWVHGRRGADRGFATTVERLPDAAGSAARALR
jgi:hypothetical protein